MQDTFVKVIVDDVVNAVVTDHDKPLSVPQVQKIVAESLEQCLLSDEYFEYLYYKIGTRAASNHAEFK